MAQAKTVTGARMKLYIDSKLAGVFGSCNVTVTYDTQAIYTLGRENAGEIVYTGMGTVDVDATGFRVVDNGPFEIATVPQLQELLNHEDISLQMIDRRDPTKVLMNVTGVRPTGFRSSASSRGIMDLSVSYTGTTFNDESGPQEDPGAVIYG